MRLLRKTCRRVVFPMIVAVRGDKILQKTTDHSILNIMYHGVVSENSNYFSPRHLTKEQFERHLKYFRKEYDIVTIREALEYKRNGFRPGKKTISVSFDDGYLNNMINALPLLEEYNIKATFFITGVCTEELDIRALWPDIVGCMKYFYNDEIIEIEGMRFVRFRDIRTNISLVDFIKKLEPAGRDRIMNYLVDKYGLRDKIKEIPEEIWRIMNKQELTIFASSDLVEIGSHGYSHCNLANVDISIAGDELVKSKSLLQDAVGREVNSIAFPDGSYNSRIKDIARETGYQYQYAVDYLLEEDITDPGILNRHGISCTTTYEANILLMNYSFHTKGI